MNCEQRISIIDGAVKCASFDRIDLSRLPKLDPLAGAKKQVVERISLVDGGVEQVEITVLPSIGGNKK